MVHTFATGLASSAITRNCVPLSLSRYQMSAPMFASRSIWVSLVRTVSTGSTWPLTVRVVGAFESILVFTIAPFFTCRSFSATTYWLTPCRSGGSSSSSPSTIRTPESPEKTCFSTSPCRWVWYQYVPGSMSVGSFHSILIEGVALHHPQDIVGDAQRRHEHPMAVQVGRLPEPIGEIDTHSVTRTHPQRGADVLALERVALDLGTGYVEGGRLDAERGSKLPVRRLQLDWRLERQALLGGKVAGTSSSLRFGSGTRCGLLVGVAAAAVRAVGSGRSWPRSRPRVITTTVSPTATGTGTKARVRIRAPSGRPRANATERFLALARGWQQGSAARLWIVRPGEPAVRACSPLKGDDEQ